MSRSPTLTPPLVTRASHSSWHDRRRGPARPRHRRPPRGPHVPALAVDQGEKDRAVGITDLARPQRAGVRSKFVTGREHADPWAGMDRDDGHAEVGEHSDMSRGDERCPARPPHPRPQRPHQHRRTASPAATGLVDRHDRPVVLIGGILEHAHGIGTGREGRAGHDPDGLSGADRPSEHRSGHDRTDHPQSCRPGPGRSGRIGGPERVSVPRRVHERRDGLLGHDRAPTTHPSDSSIGTGTGTPGRHASSTTPEPPAMGSCADVLDVVNAHAPVRATAHVRASRSGPNVSACRCSIRRPRTLRTGGASTRPRRRRSHPLGGGPPCGAAPAVRPWASGCGRIRPPFGGGEQPPRGGPRTRARSRPACPRSGPARSRRS